MECPVLGRRFGYAVHGPVSRRFTLWQGIIVLLPLLAGDACAPGAPVGAEVSSEPEPVAEVNGVTLYRSQFDDFVGRQTDKVEGQDRNELFREFLTHQALLQEASKAGFEVSDSEIEPVLALWLDDPQRATPEFRAQVREFLTIQKFIRTNIAAESEIELRDLQRYYEENSDEFVVEEQLRVLEILVADPASAERIRRGLTPGDFRSFRDQARHFSIGSTRDSGGELGLYQRGELPPKFEQVIFALQVGEVSPIFESELGSHIFTVEERVRRHPQKFHEVRGEIFERLVAERERAVLDRFVSEALARGSIRILDKSLSDGWRTADAETP